MSDFIFDLQRFEDVYNYNYNTLISGTKDNDSIYNSGDNVTINAGAGDDSISNNYSEYVTTTGGKGNDLISLGSGAKEHVILYSSGDGKDTIYGFNSTSTLSITGGSYSTQTSGYDVIVTVGDGKITLKNVFATADEININGKSTSLKRKAIKLTDKNNNIDISRDSISVAGSAADDTINNKGSKVSINAGAGNDYIDNSWDAQNVTINTGADNDYVWNSGPNAMINTGADNDNIYSSGSDVTINAGAGNDTVQIYGEYVTTTGGKGRDLISLGSDAKEHVILYASGDGKDTIYGFNSTSMLSITGGSYSTQVSGYDVIVTVGDDKITLKNVYATADKINVNGKSTALKRKVINLDKDNNEIVISRDSISVVGSSEDDTINNYASNVTISGGKGNDYIDNSWDAQNVTISGGAGNDYIWNGADSVSINASAGNDNIYSSADSVSIDAGADDDTINSYGSYVTIGGGKGNDTIYLGYYSSDNVIKYSNGDGNDYISGFNATSTLSISGSSYTKKTSGDDIIVTVGKGKITLVGAANLDKVNIKGSKTATNSWKLSGTTATYGTSSKTLATVNGVKSKSGLSISDKTIKLAANALSKKVSVSGNYVFDFASDYKKAKVTGSSSADTIKTAGANMTITGGKGNDSIVSKGKNSVITGGKGKDTLTGSSGADIFVYSDGDGNDVITNFDTNDKISLKSGTAEISTSGNDVIFTVGDGKITLKKANGKTITYVEDGKEKTYPQKSTGNVEYNSDGTAATLSSTYTKDKFEPSNYSTYKDILVTINASAVNRGLGIKGNEVANYIIGTDEDDTIYGGAGKDTILGGDSNDELYGEKGNDSLIGGAGDDSLWGGVGTDTLTGGKGSDIFYYDNGDGNDTITDYSPDIDTVVILSSYVAIGNPEADTSGDVTFKVGMGQITFKNSANKYIQLVNEGGNVLKKYSPS